MFTNYQNIDSSSTPNNMKCELIRRTCNDKLITLDRTKPYEMYNAKGELEGYYFYQGETLNLDFTIEGEITVESDAIIYTDSGMFPTNTTIGYVGQRAYNIADMISWTCTSVLHGSSYKYIWTPDEEFNYPQFGGYDIYVPVVDYLSDKIATFKLYNSRYEVIYEKSLQASRNIIIEIDKELTSMLTKGIYYCSLQIGNDSVSTTVFNSTDCKLLVK